MSDELRLSVLAAACLLGSSSAAAQNAAHVPVVAERVAGLSVLAAAPSLNTSAAAPLIAATALAAPLAPPRFVGSAVVARAPSVPVRPPHGAAGARRAPLNGATSAEPSAPPSARTQLDGVRQAWEKADPDGDVSAPSGRVAAYVEDLDGNAFGPKFPTKIVLFEKGGTREHAVTTADFAVLESRVGSDYVHEGVNLKNYELSKARGSFRNFQGRQLAVDLRHAVENLPASDWQGPSWPALIRALNDPETAPYFYVITAREHPPEALLEAFQYLQSAGFIRYLPKIENLYGVGSAHDVPGRKAEVMAGIIDGLQATAFGADASVIVNADGTGRAVLHSAGFSDDTWANFERMRDALAAQIKAAPGRWTNVKIVLFFTGLNDPAHAPGAVVLKSDGSVRALAGVERGEAGVRHLPAAPRVNGRGR